MLSTPRLCYTMGKPMRRLAPETPLFEALGAKAPYLRRLENLGLHTVGDLLAHFPTRYEDFSKVYTIAELEPGQQATIQAAVEDVRSRRTRRGLTIVEATLLDESGSIRAVWFNQPFVATTLRPGRIANFAGKISISEESELYLNHPAYEILKSSTSADGTDSQSTRHTARIVPIYPETRGLTSRGIRFVMQNVLRRVQSMKEWLPGETLATLELPELNHAYHTIHFPPTIEHALTARRRFDFENVFLLHLFNHEQKLKMAQEHAAAIPADIERVKSMLAALPFELTTSQKRSLWEIIQDMEKPRPMNRLLQGDVGSGKTVVAAIAAVIAAEADQGYQTAFMAPTEILARQHYGTMIKMAEKPVIGLLTASESVVYYPDGIESKLSKDAFHKKVAEGEIMIVFGTHALIQKNVAFKNLGLVIIDEQHRFGVRQRQALARSTAGKLTPHFLSMSATPIPRTLMLTIFGDLNLSLITELPSGRKPIETKIVSPLERQSTYDFIRAQIGEGRQAFVICPRINPAETEEESDGRNAAPAKTAYQKLELKSVTEEYEKLSKKIFPELRVAMLHGQMKPREKEEIMRRFKDRRGPGAAGNEADGIDILISTSVIEVGVDIPNATIMMIEGADRFGLAQLYQFRGRVGRGEHQSYCFLFTDSTSSTTAARLRAIIDAKNGFELAEKDLELRGPGQFFGEVQTGFPDAAMSALQDAELVKSSREAATAILAKDPALAGYGALKKRFEEFKKTIHQE
jgi:ATP-dependent DNA helicase RecG